MIRLLPLILLGLILTASPAEAGPLVAAVGALVGKVAAAWTAIGAATLGKFAIGAALQQTLLGLALSKISMMIRGKRQSNPGVKRRVEIGGDKPQPVLLGHFASAGHLIFSGSHGQIGKTPRAFYQDVVLLSVLPVTALTGIWVNGARATLGTVAHPDYGLPVTDFNKAGTDHLWIRFYDGSQTAADPMLVAQYAGDPEFAWDADMVGRGCAYAIITTRGNQELWSGQPPQVLFEIDGIALYDQSKDSTAGGSGPQRLVDRTTWGFSANPVAAVQTILTAGLGWQGQHLYGPRWPRHMLPAANVLAALGACAAITPGQDGTPEPMYRFGAELDLAMEPRAFVDELLASCAGDSAFCEGKFLIHVGPAGAPVAHFTDADCSIDHPQELDPFKGLEETFNAASSTFPDPAQAWISAPAPARYHPEWEAEDGGRKVASLRFPLVPWVTQVQRLEQSALADQRRGRVHRVVLIPPFGHIATLDYVAWTSDRNRYAAKLFKVTSARDLRQGFIELFLTEEDPDDYDPPALLPHRPDAPVRIEVPAQAVPGFMVLPWIGKDADGLDRRAGAQVIWDPEAAEDVQLLRLVVRPAGDTGEGIAIPVADFQRGELVVQDPLIPGQTYQMRARLIAARPTEWSDWVLIEVPAVLLDTVDLAPRPAAAVRRFAEWMDSDPDLDLPAAIDAATADLAQAMPRLTSAEAQIDRSLLELLGQRIEIDQLRRLGVDAGIYTDPASGLVRIIAVEQLGQRQSAAELRVDGIAAQVELRATHAYVNQAVSEALLDPTQIPIVGDLQAQVSAALLLLDAQTATINAKADALLVEGLDTRLGTAELGIDALQAAVALRVTTTDFNLLGDRVGTAETVLASLDVPEIRLTVQDTRRLRNDLDRAALGTLEDLLTGFRDRQTIREATATAQMQLRAHVDDGFASEAAARTILDTSLGQLRSLVAAEYYSRSDADAAIAAATLALSSSMAPSIATAQSAADAAHTLAGGKGKVLFQSATPAAADRLAQNLWIDTTGGTNTPKRWDGSAWVAVTDKAAIDAAAAAAGALSAANAVAANLSTNHYTKTAADAAIAAATLALSSSLTPSIATAQSAADAAHALAGGKGKVLFQSATPVAADRLAQNLWIDTTGGTNTPKRWDGSAWVAVTDKAAIDAAAAAAGALSAANAVAANLSTNHYTKVAANAAIAAATLQLQSVMEGPGGSVGLLSANLATNYYTKTAADTALAEALTSLLATGPGGAAEANFRMAALSGPDGYARLGAETRVGGAGAWRGASWYLDTPLDPALPTRFLVQADQFQVVSTAAGGGMGWEDEAIRVRDAGGNPRIIIGRLS